MSDGPYGYKCDRCANWTEYMKRPMTGRALCIPCSECGDLRAQLAEAQKDLGESAMELSRVAGPIANRIRVYRKEWQEALAEAQAEVERLRKALERIAANDPHTSGWRQATARAVLDRRSVFDRRAALASEEQDG